MGPRPWPARQRPAARPVAPPGEVLADRAPSTSRPDPAGDRPDPSAGASGSTKHGAPRKIKAANLSKEWLKAWEPSPNQCLKTFGDGAIRGIALDFYGPLWAA